MKYFILSLGLLALTGCMTEHDYDNVKPEKYNATTVYETNPYNSSYTKVVLVEVEGKRILVNTKGGLLAFDDKAGETAEVPWVVEIPTADGNTIKVYPHPIEEEGKPLERNEK